jgi:hypothetical protein
VDEARELPAAPAAEEPRNLVKSGSLDQHAPLAVEGRADDADRYRRLPTVAARREVTLHVHDHVYAPAHYIASQQLLWQPPAAHGQIEGLPGAADQPELAFAFHVLHGIAVLANKAEVEITQRPMIQYWAAYSCDKRK